MDFEQRENLYPSADTVEGAELAALDAQEAQLDAEEEKEDAVDGLDGIGRTRRRDRRATRRVRRKTRAKLAMRRSYKAGKTSTAIKTGLVKGLSSRGQFELRKSSLPVAIQAALAKGSIQPVDAAIYAIKDITGKSNIELFEASDDKKAGKTNLNRAQLDNGKYFLATEIVLEFAKGADEDDSNPALFAFGQSALPAEILNGTFEMKQGSRVIVPEISCGVFDDTDTTQRSFSYKLANPKFLVPAIDVTPELNLVESLPVGVFNPAVKVTVLGTWTEKA
jgi:hypothetical protein